MSKAVEIERLVLMAALAFPQADPENRNITKDGYSSGFDSVLDAIALLCVKKPKKEAFACAMQLDSSASAVYLTLATDDNVPPHAVIHVQDLWRQLKELSAGPDLIKLQTIAFRKAVYAYSAARQIHVFYKHFDPLRSFITQAMEYRDKNLAFEKVIWFDHLNTISKMMVCSRGFQEQALASVQLHF
jgi:hypothetical protein